jgi:L-iditol 2-dehydrogenase
MAIGRTDALTPYLRCLAPGARVSVFAGFAADAELAVLANDVHYNEWTFVGASSCRLNGFHSVAALIASGRLEVRDLLGSEFGLEDAPRALSAAASGTDLRVGINPWLN